MTHHVAALALQAALQGTTPERLQAQQRNRQRAAERAPVPAITVTVNARPADNVGPSVYVTVTTRTVSTLAADLAALAEARAQRLRAPVIIAREVAA